MKTKIISILALLAFGCTAMAQTATEILDHTAAVFKKSKGIQATFEATTFKGTTEQSNTGGTIFIKGEKFKITSTGGDIWFDGKTQWSFYHNSDEVNVSTPTAEELQSINPYTFVNLYKHGYNATARSIRYNGMDCHEVRLTAQQSQKALQEMRIIIDKRTGFPHSVRLKQKGDWFRARISNIHGGHRWDDDFFRFNAKEHPNVEIIDLR